MVKISLFICDSYVLQAHLLIGVAYLRIRESKIFMNIGVVGLVKKWRINQGEDGSVSVSCFVIIDCPGAVLLALSSREPFLQDTVYIILF